MYLLCPSISITSQLSSRRSTRFNDHLPTMVRWGTGMTACGVTSVVGSWVMMA